MSAADAIAQIGTAKLGEQAHEFPGSNWASLRERSR
jgi:hypothetical protein